MRVSLEVMEGKLADLERVQGNRLKLASLFTAALEESTQKRGPACNHPDLNTHLCITMAQQNTIT